MVDGNDAAPPGHELLSLYDVALPQVYGYLLRRCGSAPLAEDLTSETFVAAVDAVCRSTPPELSVAWLIGVARNKLVDHWRRHERSRRIEVQLAESVPIAADDWEVHLDAVAAHAVLLQLGPHHRGALVLRYLDGLSVPEVAHQLDRSVKATEVLLVRARRAFRTLYESHAREEER
ncbi:MAG: sigma-70 family RNA polymerase sigma factor [Acidimicrobiales bacterium]|nr:sigma-70 family RNA polymerase sigma factor [Acidimicrobiales bacterium]